MCAIIHHSSYFNFYFILERVEGQNMRDKRNSGYRKERKFRKIIQSRNFYNVFVFIPPHLEWGSCCPASRNSQSQPSHPCAGRQYHSPWMWTSPVKYSLSPWSTNNTLLPECVQVWENFHWHLILQTLSPQDLLSLRFEASKQFKLTPLHTLNI